MAQVGDSGRRGVIFGADFCRVSQEQWDTAVRCQECRCTELRTADRAPLLRCCSAAVKREAVVAGVAAAAAVVLATPLAAQAAATPSLNNLFGSLVAGGVVLAGIVVAVSTVS